MSKTSLSNKHSEQTFGGAQNNYQEMRGQAQRNIPASVNSMSSKASVIRGGRKNYLEDIKPHHYRHKCGNEIRQRLTPNFKYSSEESKGFKRESSSQIGESRSSVWQRSSNSIVPETIGSSNPSLQRYPNLAKIPESCKDLERLQDLLSSDAHLY